jgi:hypothetical protein
MSDERIQSIETKRIRLDGGTQLREELPDGAVDEYLDVLRAKKELPRIVVFWDGKHWWLADGFCRLEARNRNGEKHVLCNVLHGSQRDAVLYACGANAAHGCRRTNADKRKAVGTLLADPEWSAWSNGEIARRCSVSDHFVSVVRRELTPIKSESTQTVRRGADGRVTNVSAIGPKLLTPRDFQAMTPVQQAEVMTAAERAAEAEEAAEEQARRDEEANAPVKMLLLIPRAMAERIDAAARKVGCNREKLALPVALAALTKAWPEPKKRRA